MLKVAFGLYRQWGFDIFKEIYDYQKLRGDFKIGPIIVCSEYQFKIPQKLKKELQFSVVDPNDTQTIYSLLKKAKVDIVCMYSWSWIVKRPIIDDFICLCLHPSLVPKNRGGTPIQNQMVNGIDDSGVSLFRMNEGIDSGPLYKQTAMSLRGNLNDVFARMTELGSILTKNLISDYINGTLKFKAQESIDKYPVLKRRKPEQSEIKLGSLGKMKFEDLDNLVRGLLPPYPTIFIVKNNQKIFIESVEKYPQKPRGLNFKVKDGWARITKYHYDKIPSR